MIQKLRFQILELLRGFNINEESENAVLETNAENMSRKESPPSKRRKLSPNPPSPPKIHEQVPLENNC